MGYYSDLSISHQRTSDDDYLDRKDYGVFNPARAADQARTDVRRQLDTAAVAGGIIHGGIVWSRAERLDRLMTRLRWHLRHGRPQAAQACRRMVERMLDEMDGED